MIILYILDKEHNILPVEKEGMEAWGEWHKKIGNRTVKKEKIGETEISTVFLGMDHGFGNVRPVLFETMVFGPLDPDNEIQERCCTWDEALIQHEQVKQLLLDRLKSEQNTPTTTT